MNEQQFKVLSGGVDEEGNPLYLIKDTENKTNMIGDYEICKKVIEQQEIIPALKEENEQLKQRIKDKNTYQRVLEAKIRRLKNRIKVLEK